MPDFPLTLCNSGASLVAQMLKNLPAMQTWVQSLGWEDSVEEGMATYSSILAKRLPWTEPGSPLVVESLWGLKESYMTERLSTLCNSESVTTPLWASVLSSLWWRSQHLSYRVTKVKVLVIQLFPTLCNPMECSQPGSRNRVRVK